MRTEIMRTQHALIESSQQADESCVSKKNTIKQFEHH